MIKEIHDRQDELGGHVFTDSGQVHMGLNQSHLPHGGSRGRLFTLAVVRLLVHEACHVHRHLAGFAYTAATASEEERYCEEVAWVGGGIRSTRRTITQQLSNATRRSRRKR